MGTIINGNKWIGACVNGNIVSGLVKNEIVFYKKNQQELYKRRIVIGDNLKGKTIYPEFTTSSTDRFIDNTKRNMIIFNDNNDESIYLIQHATATSEGLCQDIIASISNAEYIYRKSEASNFKQNNITVFNDKDYFVTNIDDSFSSYRCLFVEDKNIRPLQTGDKIVKGTKLYFNFPDNLTNIEDKTIFSLDTMEDLYLKTLFGKIYITDREEVPPPASPSILSIEPTEEGYIHMKEVFNTENSLNIINLSTYIYECYGYQEGIPVNEVDNELINYVLVDITTLGN